jgi:AraC family transcriptional regulator
MTFQDARPSPTRDPAATPCRYGRHMPQLLDSRIGPYERHLLAGSGYVLGGFHCPPDAARWREPNWIGERTHVVLPSTAVRIGAGTAPDEVRTVNEVVVYDRDTMYRRGLVSAEGDRCTFVAVGDELADELGLNSGTGVRHAPCATQPYLRVHRALAALRRPNPDLLTADEAVLAVLGHAARRLRTRRRADRADRGAAATIDAVKDLLAGAPTRVWTLAELGAAVHYSPYFLARTFHRHTGYPIARYRRLLCLRQSLPRVLRTGADLSRIAAEHGFSSHSHYTLAFRAAFGCTPSQARGAQVPIT